MIEIFTQCQYLLNNYPSAESTLDYLNSRLPNRNKFEFGYFPNSKNIKALTSLIDEKELISNNLLFKSIVNDTLSHRTMFSLYFENHSLIIPFKDSYGKIVAFVGRTILSEEERKINNLIKYKNTTPFQKGNYLFGLFENKESIIEKDCVYIVEGQFDVITASEKLLDNIVALGNSYMTPNQFALITRYTKNINLLLDNDQAGEKGRENILKKFGHLANFENIYLTTEYKDIDSFLQENSVNDLNLA